MSDDVRERVERFVETHPNASAMQVLAQLGLGPDYKDLVEDVVNDIPHDYSADEWERIKGRGWEVGTDRQCASSGCRNERRNPHPDSFCAECAPTAVASGQQAETDGGEDRGE